MYNALVHGVGLEVAIIALLILANGVFAMAEIAVVSARKAKLQQWAEEGDVRARAALELAARPNRFLAAVQVGISLVGVLAGAFGGATIAETIAAWARTVPALAPYGGAIGLGVVVAGITFFSLVLGELVPKRLGLNNPERIAKYVAEPMRALAFVTTPVVRVLEASTNAVIWLLRMKPSQDPVITPEELKVLISQGTESGVFEEVEQEMLEGVLHLGDRTAGMLMTPRTRIVYLDVDDDRAEVLRKLSASHRSRFPVIQHDPENVIGVVRAKDLLVQVLAGQARRPAGIPAAHAVRARDDARAQGARDAQAARRAHRDGHGRIRQRAGPRHAQRHPRGHRRRYSLAGRGACSRSDPARRRDVARRRPARDRRTAGHARPAAAAG